MRGSKAKKLRREAKEINMSPVTTYEKFQETHRGLSVAKGCTRYVYKRLKERIEK